MQVNRKLVTLLTLSFSLLAYGQFRTGGMESGSGVTRAEYQTTSAIALGVNPDGGQASGCAAASSSTGDCRTIAAALGSLPKSLRDTALISVDAGTFQGAFTFSGFQSYTIDAGASNSAATPSGNNAFIRITGAAWQAFTPATGTATGTVTSSTAASTTTGDPFVITDSAGTWTTGDLVGAFLQMTSGSSTAITNKIPIIENTGTSITVAQSVTVSNGNTFQIQIPSSIIKAPASPSGFPLVIGQNNVHVILEDFEWQCDNSNTSSLPSIIGALPSQALADLQTSSFTFNRVRFNCPSNTSNPIVISGSNVTFNRVSADVAGGFLRMQTGSSSQVDITSSIIKSRSCSTGYATIATGPGTLTFSNSWMDVPDGQVGIAINNAQKGSNANIAFAGGGVRCQTGGTGYGIILGNSPNQGSCGAASINTGIGSFAPQMPINLSLNAFRVIGCGTGILARGANSVIRVGTTAAQGGTFSTLNSGVLLYQGAKAYFTNSGNTLAFTSVTNELGVDDQIFPYAALGNGVLVNGSGGTGFYGGSVPGPVFSGRGVTLPSMWESQFPDPADAGSRGMILYGRDAGTLYFAENESIGVNPAVTGRWSPLENGSIPRPLMSLPLGVTLAGAGAVLGYTAAPMDVNRMNVSAMTLRVTTAGTVGSTNASIRVSDGTSNCDCSFACNTANSSTIVPTCASGCSFDAGVALVITDNSKGDCAVGPVLTVNSGQLWGTAH